MFKYFPYTAQPHLHRDGVAHGGQGSLPSIINQENASTDTPTGQVDGDTSLLVFLLPMCFKHAKFGTRRAPLKLCSSFLLLVVVMPLREEPL